MAEFFIGSGLISASLGIALLRSGFLHRRKINVFTGILFTAAGLFIFLTGLFLLL
jgi:hypothetical protein